MRRSNTGMKVGAGLAGGKRTKTSNVLMEHKYGVSWLYIPYPLYFSASLLSSLQQCLVLEYGV
jgi:hypothetical protein